MTTRRRFLQVTAIAAVVPIVGPKALAADASREGLAVFDERFVSCRRFGGRAKSAGWTVRAIEGDVTSLWFEALSGRWADRPVPVLGMTARPSLFCLEQLAWDHRLRVVYHVEHISQPDGEFRHSPGIEMDPSELRVLAAAGERWPEAMAEVLAGVSTEGRGACGPSRASMPARLGDESVLHSWVIAPVVSAARASA